MSLTFSNRAWAEYAEWQQNNKAIVKRINQLITAIQRDAFEGIGKPEPLKHQLAGWWSRRITDEHRLVYRVHNGHIEIASLKNHYQA
ncbi:MAG: Txe/YoeB family addiction module toxin [Pseudomonadota bacterium]